MKKLILGVAMLVVAVGISGGAQARLNRSECKATCNANAPDPAACYVKYQCDSQPDGPVNKARSTTRSRRTTPSIGPSSPATSAPTGTSDSNWFSQRQL